MTPSERLAGFHVGQPVVYLDGQADPRVRSNEGWEVSNILTGPPTLEIAVRSRTGMYALTTPDRVAAISPARRR